MNRVVAGEEDRDLVPILRGCLKSGETQIDGATIQRRRIEQTERPVHDRAPCLQGRPVSARPGPVFEQVIVAQGRPPDLQLARVDHVVRVGRLDHGEEGRRSIEGQGACDVDASGTAEAVHRQAVGRVFDHRSHLVRRQAGILREYQPGQARHIRRRERGAEGGGVIAEVGGPDVAPGCGDIDPGPVVRIVRPHGSHVGHRDPDDVRKRARVPRSRDAVVSRGRDQDDSGGMGRLDLDLHQRVGAVLADVVVAEAHVDDAGPVLRGVMDRLGHRAGRESHAQRHDPASPADSGDAERIVGRRRGHAGDCGLVHFIRSGARVRVVAGEVPTGPDVRGQVGMTELHPFADDRDDHRIRGFPSGRDIPPRLGVRGLVRPLHRIQRVVRDAVRDVDVIQLSAAHLRKRAIFRTGGEGVRSTRQPQQEGPGQGRGMPLSLAAQGRGEECPSVPHSEPLAHSIQGRDAGAVIGDPSIRGGASSDQRGDPLVQLDDKLAANIPGAVTGVEVAALGRPGAAHLRHDDQAEGRSHGDVPPITRPTHGATFVAMQTWHRTSRVPFGYRRSGGHSCV